jgi:hypothetical protein
MGEKNKIRGELRMHDDEAKSLHLVNPGLVLLAESGNGRPLILAPEKFLLVWVLHWTVEVDRFVVVSDSHSDVLL